MSVCIGQYRILGLQSIRVTLGKNLQQLALIDGHFSQLISARDCWLHVEGHAQVSQRGGGDNVLVIQLEEIFFPRYSFE
jgi:hypothetical protein